MEILLDFTPQLMEGIRTVVREELERKAADLKKYPKSFSRKEAKGLLGCSLPTLDKYIRSGRIKSEKVGRKIFIPESSISDFLGGINSN